MDKANLLIISLIITGAANTIILSMQDRQKIPTQQSPSNQIFFHPFIQLALMFIGQILSIVPYLFIYLVKPKKNLLQISGFMKQKCPLYYPAIPGLMDLLASGIAYIALNLIASSVWQISRGGVIITTAIFSRIILHKKFDKSSIIGCSLTFIGITFVQIFEIILVDNEHQQNRSTGQQIIGVILLFISLIFNTITLISQKIIFNKFTINPLKMVFLEGIYGFIAICLIILALCNIQCPDQGFIRDKCLEVDGKFYIESITVFFSQIASNQVLMILILLFVLSITISVPIAVTISKVINPLSRTISDVCRTVLVWIFGIAITLLFGQDNEEYDLQKKGILLNILKGIGFTIVIAGTLIYHGFLIKPRNVGQNQQSLLLSEQAQRNLDKYINNLERKSSNSKKNSQFERQSFI